MSSDNGTSLSPKATKAHVQFLQFVEQLPAMPSDSGERAKVETTEAVAGAHCHPEQRRASRQDGSAIEECVGTVKERRSTRA